MENRFKQARTVHNRHGMQSTKEVSQATGVTKSLIEDLESSVYKPRGVSYLTVKKLAEYYGVSADYLLGLSHTPSVDEDIQVACKVTGLSEKAINAIKSSGEWGLDVLNCFLENPDSFSLLSAVRRLAMAKYVLKAAETALIGDDSANAKSEVLDLTEKQIVQEYWAVENFKELQKSTVDNLISRKEFQKMADVVVRAEKKGIKKKET